MIRDCRLFILLTLIPGCADDGMTKAIQSKLIIDIRENLYAGDSRLLLYAETEEGYSCGDYEILRREIALGHNGIRIDFPGLSDGCYNNSAGSASTRVNLGDFPTGVYPLELNNGFMKNRGTLVVTPTDIKLEFGLKKGIRFVREEWRRVPLNTYWGEIVSFTYLAEPKIEAFNEN